MEDELDQLKPTGLSVDIQCWNIEDLQSYVGTMHAQIKRVENLIIEKNKVNLAANALFISDTG